MLRKIWNWIKSWFGRDEDFIRSSGYVVRHPNDPEYHFKFNGNSHQRRKSRREQKLLDHANRIVEQAWK